MAMPSSSVAGSSLLDAQESDDTCLEGVVVVDAAAARGGAGSMAPSDVWAELFPAAPIVGDPAEPPELRPLERDLCLAAYGVAQEDVTRELQWRCGGGSGVGICNLGQSGGRGLPRIVHRAVAPFSAPHRSPVGPRTVGGTINSPHNRAL